MPLIKSQQATSVIHGAVVVDFEDLGRQAALILERARQEANELLDAARQEAKELQQQARQSGEAQGRAEGLELGRQAGSEEGRTEALASYQSQLAELVEQWQTTLEQFESHRAGLLESCRTDVIQLALAIARRVVYRVVHTDANVIADQLADALALVAQASEVEVVVHPDQETLVRDVLPDICATLQQVDSVSLTLDDEITPGGCLVRTQRGSVDGTIETQIDRIIDELLPVTPDGSSE